MWKWFILTKSVEISPVDLLSFWATMTVKVSSTNTSCSCLWQAEVVEEIYVGTISVMLSDWDRKHESRSRTHWNLTRGDLLQGEDTLSELERGGLEFTWRNGKQEFISEVMDDCLTDFRQSRYGNNCNTSPLERLQSGSLCNGVKHLCHNSGLSGDVILISGVASIYWTDPKIFLKYE